MSWFDKSLVWFRRDLRSFDHAALHHALEHSRVVFCVFVFDTDILDALPRYDRRVEFIHASVVELDRELRALGGGLIVLHGSARRRIPELARELGVDAVFANHDYEPAAKARDEAVADALKASGCRFLGFKDQVIFEKDEVISLSGKPFSVFTPYKNAWLKKLHADEDCRCLMPYPVEQYRARLAPAIDGGVPSLADLGFWKTNLSELGIPAGMPGGEALIEDFQPRMQDYHLTRDFPGIKGPSYLSVHLRFGTVSIRGLMRRAVETMRLTQGGSGAAAWLSELIWREFYFMILHHHTHVVERAFKPEYDAIRWEDGDRARELFQAWRDGRTGYPLVDAAMAQLNRTGYMHNRLRMVSASFLVKDLGIDWRWGERYFAEKLNDYDLAVNNGGWQWAASTGCDAQPWFRIFNPVIQSKKFDPEGKFIKRYLPQLQTLSAKFIHAPWTMPKTGSLPVDNDTAPAYPAPIVMHESARRLTLKRYAVVKKPEPTASG